jgi:hypothetical protein
VIAAAALSLDGRGRGSVTFREESVKTADAGDPGEA